MTGSKGGFDRVEAAAGVLLRRPIPADVAGLFAVHGHPSVYTLDPTERHRDLAHTRGWMEPFLADWERGDLGYWTVLVPREWWADGQAGPADEDGERVIAGMGGIRFHQIGPDDRALNVYFRLAPAVHGRGLAGIIVDEAITQAGRLAPGVDLVVRTRPANGAARRVAERAGFVDQGIVTAEPGMQRLRLFRGAAPDLGVR